MILLIKNFHLDMTLTSIINFQVRDLDLQAMGGGRDSTQKICGHIPIIRPDMNPIYPRVWKIMKYKVHKSVTHDVTRGRTDNSYLHTRQQKKRIFLLSRFTSLKVMIFYFLLGKRICLCMAIGFAAFSRHNAVRQKTKNADFCQKCFL